MKQVTIGVTTHTEKYGDVRIEVSDTDATSAVVALDAALAELCKTKPRETATDVATETTPEVVDLDPSKLPKVCDKCGVRVSEADAVASALHMRGVVRCLKCRYPGLETKQTPPPETTDQVCVICGLSALNTGGLSAGGKCAACMEFDAKSEAAKAKPTQKTISPTQTPKTPPIVKSATKEAAKDPTAAPTYYTCEACGVEIARVQHDVSQLFQNRDLCKACMKSQPLERAA